MLQIPPSCWESAGGHLVVTALRSLTLSNALLLGGVHFTGIEVFHRSIETLYTVKSTHARVPGARSSCTTRFIHTSLPYLMGQA